MYSEVDKKSLTVANLDTEEQGAHALARFDDQRENTSIQRKLAQLANSEEVKETQPIQRKQNALEKLVQRKTNGQVAQMGFMDWVKKSWKNKGPRKGESPDEANVRKDTNRIRGVGKWGGGLSMAAGLAGVIAGIATGGVLPALLAGGALLGGGALMAYKLWRAHRRDKAEGQRHVMKYGVKEDGTSALPDLVGSVDNPEAERRRWNANLTVSKQAWETQDQYAAAGLVDQGSRGHIGQIDEATGDHRQIVHDASRAYRRYSRIGARLSGHGAPALSRDEFIKRHLEDRYGE